MICCLAKAVQQKSQGFICDLGNEISGVNV